MSKKDLTRRVFLSRASAVGLVAIGSGTILSACGGGESGGSASEMPAAEPSEPSAEAAGADCTDLSSLSDSDLQMRQTLAYVDVSPHADKVCDNCQLWTTPEAGSACGGCQIIKGPIAPKGYCTSWAAKLS